MTYFCCCTQKLWRNILWTVNLTSLYFNSGKTTCRPSSSSWSVHFRLKIKSSTLKQFKLGLFVIETIFFYWEEIKIKFTLEIKIDLKIKLKLNNWWILKIYGACNGKKVWPIPSHWEKHLVRSKRKLTTIVIYL